MRVSNALSGIIILLFCAVPPGFADLIAPSSTTVDVSAGQTFSVDALVANIQDLYAFQFDWSFDPTILTAVSVSEGAFLPLGGSTFFLPGLIDNTGGVISDTADSLLGPVIGINGTGILASATFTAKISGTAAITLPNQILLDSNLNPILPPGSNVPEPSTLALAEISVLSLIALRINRKVDASRHEV